MSLPYSLGVKLAVEGLGMPPPSNSLEIYPGAQASARKRRWEKILKEQLKPGTQDPEPRVGSPGWNLEPRGQGLE